MCAQITLARLPLLDVIVAECLRTALEQRVANILCPLKLIQCQPAKASLLSAAAHLRLQPHARATAHVQRPDALGAIELVATDGHQVDVHLINIHRDLANCLQLRIVVARSDGEIRQIQAER
jgi:hypothetical protein